jgi:putative glutamine amidotransferase
VMERIYDQLHGKNSPHPNPPPAGEGIITIAVNSAHHQAVAKPAPGTIVNATAPDGVIEGIEYPPHRFCLGVQWHPEYFVTEADEKIMRAFVDEAKA